MGYWAIKLKSEEFTGKLIFGIIVLFILIGIGVQFYKQKEIQQYKQNTIGKVIDFNYENKTYYNIIYEYTIEGKRYTNQIGVSFFKCDNGKKGCVGSEFPVYYSYKNPHYSRIDLGKYEKYKTTVEFIK